MSRAVGGDESRNCRPRAATVATIFDNLSLRVPVDAESNAEIAPAAAEFYTVADASGTVEVGRTIKDVRIFLVVIPAVNTKLFAVRRCSEVASHDMTVDAFHVAEFKRSARADICFVKVAEVFAGLSINDFYGRMVVDAVEFAIVVAEVTYF